MLASTIDPEINSPRVDDVSRLVVDEKLEPVEDIWAGINFTLLYKQLSSGINDQTHPWDPVVETSSIRPQNENFPNFQNTRNLATTRHTRNNEARGHPEICHSHETGGHIALNLPSCISKNRDQASSEDNSEKLGKVGRA